jgi:hypothetical protein
VAQYRWRMAMDPTVLTVEQEKAKAARPGSDFRECASGCPVMIVIPAGNIMHRELTRIWKATKASIIFVTHSLEEAIFLGNRVLAMTPGAVGLTGELPIDLPRPRDPLSVEFASLRRKLFEMLTAHLEDPADILAE